MKFNTLQNKINELKSLICKHQDIKWSLDIKKLLFSEEAAKIISSKKENYIDKLKHDICCTIKNNLSNDIVDDSSVDNR